MLALNCVVVSELCNGMLCIFSLNQLTCSSSLRPLMIVDLKTGRKGRKGYKIQAHWFGPQSAQIPGCLQSSTAAGLYPSTQGKFTALQRALLSLTSLLLASLTFSCTWTFLLSVPDHSSVTNYHCWAATSRIFPAQTASCLTHVKHIWSNYHVQRKKGRENKKQLLVAFCWEAAWSKYSRWGTGSCNTEVVRSSLTVRGAKILLLFVVVADCTFCVSHCPLGYGRVCLAGGQIFTVCCCCFPEIVVATYRLQYVHNSNLFSQIICFFFLFQKNKTQKHSECEQDWVHY